MISKAAVSLIKSLHNKKGRSEKNLFLVEGEKSIVELLSSDFFIEQLFVTETFYTSNTKAVNRTQLKYEIVTEKELGFVGTLESNNAALAVVRQKENSSLAVATGEIVLALDDISDPGNLGTIVRIADWYGITKIIASTSTTDRYNSKTIAASMGSFTRVNMFYTDLDKYLSNTKVPIIGSFVKEKDVQDLHVFTFPKAGILLMGSESNGIDYKLPVTQKITIPSYGKAESLNVSIATAVILDTWKRAL